jgi:hypothetical protein
MTGSGRKTSEFDGTWKQYSGSHRKKSQGFSIGILLPGSKEIDSYFLA